MDDLKAGVERRLKSMGLDPSAIDERSLEQLLRIQRAVNEESSRIAVARKVAKHGMPMVRVAEMTGLSRQTIYKPLLKAYAERAIRDAGICEDSDELARLRKIVAEHERTIEDLVKRDGELVEAQIKLREARQEIAALKSSLAEAKGSISQLRRMLDELGKAKPPAKVIPIK